MLKEGLLSATLSSSVWGENRLRIEPRRKFICKKKIIIKERKKINRIDPLDSFMVYTSVCVCVFTRAAALNQCNIITLSCCLLLLSKHS